MTAQQTKTIQLRKNKEVFNDLVGQHKKIASSIADLQKTLKSVDQQILDAIPKDVTEIVVDSGTIKLGIGGGNVTWKQDELVDAIREFTGAGDIYTVLTQYIALKPKLKTCEDAGFKLDNAKKVADTYPTIKII